MISTSYIYLIDSSFLSSSPSFFTSTFKPFLCCPSISSSCSSNNHNTHQFSLLNLSMKTMRNQEVTDIAKYLMLLSCKLQTKFKKCSSSPNHVYECKTCNRKFSSFQALGGHRASHKKPKTLTGSDEASVTSSTETKSAESIKAKKHDCSICGMEFSLGQAPGGHMRKHRMMDGGFASSIPSEEVVAQKSPVLMRMNSKRVMSLDMDLNLTPLENDLKVLFGNMTPKRMIL